MPAQISKAPVGYLDFFGIKNGGRNPIEVASTVAPVIDVVPFYLASEWEVVVETGLAVAGTNPGTFALTVPPGEVWYVKEFGISTAPLGAGITVKLQPSYAILSGTVSNLQCTGPSDLYAQATAGEICRAAIRDFIVPGGGLFQVTPLQNVGGFIGPVVGRWVFARFLR